MFCACQGEVSLGTMYKGPGSQMMGSRAIWKVFGHLTPDIWDEIRGEL